MSAKLQHMLAAAIEAHRRGQTDVARSRYLALLRLAPEHPDALNLLAMLERQVGNLDKALSLARRAVSRAPRVPAFHMTLGMVLRGLGQLDEAVGAYRRAIQLDPKSADAYYNLGNALKDQGRHAEALQAYARSEALQPNAPDLLTNQGLVLKELGQPQEAIERYNRALALAPDFALARWNRAVARLMIGDYQQGWEDYEARWLVPGLLPPPPRFPSPRWNGEPVEGKAVLVWVEQGYGDAIQFVRFARMLQSRGARVLLYVHEPLVELMRTLDDAIPVLGPGDTLPPHDFNVSALSLPRLLGVTLETLPNRSPYLRVPTTREPTREALLAEVEAVPRGTLRVALAWGGNPENDADRWRSIPFQALAPLLEVKGAHFFSIQKGPWAEAVEKLPSPNLTHLGPRLRDFADTAAVLSCMDLVITVCTSIAHLAGALGLRTWTALHFSPCWRWMLQREDSPWYPTMRLFRQERLGDWSAPVERMARELSLLAARSGSGASA